MDGLFKPGMFSMDSPLLYAAVAGGITIVALLLSYIYSKVMQRRLDAQLEAIAKGKKTILIVHIDHKSYLHFVAISQVSSKD